MGQCSIRRNVAQESKLGCLLSAGVAKWSYLLYDFMMIPRRDFAKFVRSDYSTCAAVLA